MTHHLHQLGERHGLVDAGHVGHEILHDVPDARIQPVSLAGALHHLPLVLTCRIHLLM